MRYRTDSAAIARFRQAPLLSQARPAPWGDTRRLDELAVCIAADGWRGALKLANEAALQLSYLRRDDLSYRVLQTALQKPMAGRLDSTAIALRLRTGLNVLRLCRPRLGGNDYFDAVRSLVKSASDASTARVADHVLVTQGDWLECPEEVRGAIRSDLADALLAAEYRRSTTASQPEEIARSLQAHMRAFQPQESRIARDLMRRLEVERLRLPPLDSPTAPDILADQVYATWIAMIRRNSSALLASWALLSVTVVAEVDRGLQLRVADHMTAISACEDISNSVNPLQIPPELALQQPSIDGEYLARRTIELLWNLH